MYSVHRFHEHTILAAHRREWEDDNELWVDEKFWNNIVVAYLKVADLRFWGDWIKTVIILSPND
jgi:hypothetical protein